MSEWRKYKLGEICDVRDGTHDSPKAKPSGYPLVTSKNIKDGKIDLLNTYLISEADYRFVNQRSKVEQWDILYSMIGTIGECAIVKDVPTFAIKNVGLFKTNGNQLLAQWIYYYLHSSVAQKELTGRIKGSTQQYISLTDLREFPIMIPPIDEQERIAGVLSSLDDKIDLLNRENTTLEALAETLFRQWFIEDAKEDWEEFPLEYVCERITDGSHYSPESVEVGLPMASVKDMEDWGINLTTCRKISKEEFDKLVSADCLPQVNDILIAKDGSYLKHIFVVNKMQKVVILSSIAIIRPNGLYHPYLLSILLKSDSTKEELKNIVTGAVIPRIVLKDFRKFPILLPPQKKQEQALSFIEPIMKKCFCNREQIQTLIETRDGLLPRVLGREIKI